MSTWFWRFQGFKWSQLEVENMKNVEILKNQQKKKKKKTSIRLEKVVKDFEIPFQVLYELLN